MHSHFFGLSTQDSIDYESLIDDVLPNAEEKISYGNGYLAIQGNSYQTPDYACYLYGQITNREQLEKDFTENAKSWTVEQLIVALFQKYQESAFSKVLGNVILIFLEKQENVLYLFRCSDALVSTYFYEGKDFIFASEMRYLLCCNRLVKRLDQDALSAYLQLGFIPSPSTPIRNMSTLLPGFLLIYSNGKVKLRKLQERTQIKLETSAASTVSFPSFDLSRIIQQVFQLDAPQSMLFFPSIFQAQPTDFIFANALEISTITKPSQPASFSHILRHLKPIFSKIYFSTHPKIASYSEFKNKGLIFSTRQLKKAFPEIADLFMNYAFFAKKYYEEGIDRISSILLQQDALFLPYIKCFKAWKDPQSFKAGLIERYQTNQDLINRFLSAKTKQFLIEILEHGSLVDLDLLKANFVPKMTPMQLWTVFILEIWIRLCIDSNPTQTSLEAVQSSFHLQI